MREFPEVPSCPDVPAFTVQAPRAAGASSFQVPRPAPRTFCFYGYQIGEEVDPLLCGHPGLRY